MGYRTGLATRLARGYWSPGCCRLRSGRYPGQHTQRLDTADVQHVCITAQYHPLCGQSFPVLQRRLKRGEAHFIIQLPSGATQLIPARWTTSSPTPVTPSTPLLTSGTLRGLVTMVAILRNSSAQEATHDSPDPARALDHLQSSDPAPPRLSVDPLAPAPSPGSPGASPRRRP